MLKKLNKQYQIFNKMQEMVKQGKWGKGAYYDHAGHFCMAGLYCAAKLGEEYVTDKNNAVFWGESHGELDAFIQEHDINIGDSITYAIEEIKPSISAWNDDPDTTEEDVINLLETMKTFVDA